MILPEAFNKNESLRQALVKARPILDIAFYAADNAEKLDIRLDDSNALSNTHAHAGQVAIERYKNRIRSMMSVAPGEPSPLLDAHLGIDAYEQIRIDAEREAASKEESQKNKTTKRK